MGLALGCMYTKKVAKAENPAEKDPKELLEIELKKIDIETKKQDLIIKGLELEMKKHEIILKKAEFERYMSEKDYIISTYDLVLLEKRLGVLQSMCSVATSSYVEPSFADIIHLLELFGHNTSQFIKLRNIYDNNLKNTKEHISKIYG